MKWMHKRLTRWAIALVALYAILFLLPMPYYLYQPGTVEPLSAAVSVADGKKDSKGTFNLTTVLSVRANNVATVLYGLFAKDTELRKASDVKGNLSDAEYMRVLDHMWSSSQQTSVAAAMGEAGLTVEPTVTGQFLRMLQPGSDAQGVLEIGDVLIKVDDLAVKELSAVIDYLGSSKKVGDTVTLTYLRDGEQHAGQVKLIGIDGSNQPGIGAVFEPEYAISSSRSITFAESEIGGPSAGLMFSLEILDQLLPEDLTHGLKIAGTGTIDLNGRVGQIGGMRDKIVAAHKAGVDLFFCPKDTDASSTNAQDAIDEASKRGYTLRIVPVATLKEAVDYLHNWKA
ncbi:SepM family pheromone-processing serine protease [Paenibacillus sp. MMS18-CY102]|uniref:SepM family pheromone-processing serine protease n=1 Tax=Paenibacillus sp. MMS18-CY102 TaxID=2682849 RepID=UPI001365B38A|nr:SepM family pheromone-processing serine protease [Paenibacillus sp. MMS18-CY102]MWC27025.1 PDZ domain-containing protein [Paenibacillus sp. MMS18-CY102]